MDASLDGAPYALSRLMPIAAACCSKDSATASFQDSRSGTMYARSAGAPGAVMSMSSAPGFPARTSAPQELAQELMANAPGSGGKWRALPVRFDRASSSWKTHHCLWAEDLQECSVTLPTWGCMHDGELWELPTWERPISAGACGWLPTPTATDARGRTYHFSCGDKTKAVPSLLGVAKLLPTPLATDWKGRYTWETVRRRIAMARGVRLPEELSRRDGKAIIPNPEFWEWMMGWPIGSTGLRPLEMDKFQQWLRQHGGCSVSTDAREYPGPDGGRHRTPAERERRGLIG